jgi:hypothetical protein
VSSHTQSISQRAVKMGWLVYTPPKELGDGRQIPAWGPGGFGLWLGGSGSSHELRVQGSGTTRALSFAQARAAADEVDRWLKFERSQTARETVEAIIKDLPVALDRAIQVADARTGQLREMRAAASGDFGAGQAP